MSTMTPKEHQELTDLLQTYIDMIADLIQAHVDIAAVDNHSPQGKRAEAAVRQANNLASKLSTTVGGG